MTVAAILLAGGASSRMGQPKALLPWGDQKLVEYQIDQLRQPPVERVVVVLGPEAERIRPVVEQTGAEVRVDAEVVVVGMNTPQEYEEAKAKYFAEEEAGGFEHSMEVRRVGHEPGID